MKTSSTLLVLAGSFVVALASATVAPGVAHAQQRTYQGNGYTVHTSANGVHVTASNGFSLHVSPDHGGNWSSKMHAAGGSRPRRDTLFDR